MTNPETTTVFAGLDGRTTARLPAWYARQRSAEESTTFATILSRGLEAVGVGHSKGTSPEIGDLWCANESLCDSLTPVETALPVDTPVSAKRVVEAGSPTLKERAASAASE